VSAGAGRGGGGNCGRTGGGWRRGRDSGSRPPRVRITTAELLPADAERLASDFAEVLGEYGATYGG
jgi:hypothetical protein